MLRSIQLRLPLLLLVLTSCVTVGDRPNTHKANLGPWVMATPKLQSKIEANAQRLPWTHGIERIEMITWFAEIGEPGYSVLLDLALDEREDVACAALAALGATGDSRLVEPLRDLPWPKAGDTDLTLERARTLLRLGDWSMLGRLIGGLKDPRVMVRAMCSAALFEATHERHGFEANAPEAERDASIAKWDMWWAARGADPMR